MLLMTNPEWRAFERHEGGTSRGQFRVREFEVRELESSRVEELRGSGVTAALVHQRPAASGERSAADG
jgi:hypothetical protein